MSKRAERRYESYKKYRQRLKKWLPGMDWRPHEKKGTWRDLEKEDSCKFLKHTSTPCSCYMCEGESYDRNKQKHIDNKIVVDELDDWARGWCDLEEEYYMT